MKDNCAFIFLAPGCNYKVNRVINETDAVNMYCIGVGSYEEAEETAREMAAIKCSAIELCAGFGHEGVARVQKAVGRDIPVGVIRFDRHPSMGMKSGDDFFVK